MSGDPTMFEPKTAEDITADLERGWNTLIIPWSHYTTLSGSYGSVVISVPAKPAGRDEHRPSWKLTPLERAQQGQRAKAKRR